MAYVFPEYVEEDAHLMWVALGIISEQQLSCSESDAFMKWFTVAVYNTGPLTFFKTIKSMPRKAEDVDTDIHLCVKEYVLEKFVTFRAIFPLAQDVPPPPEEIEVEQPSTTVCEFAPKVFGPALPPWIAAQRAAAGQTNPDAELWPVDVADDLEEVIDTIPPSRAGGEGAMTVDEGLDNGLALEASASILKNDVVVKDFVPAAVLMGCNNLHHSGTNEGTFLGARMAASSCAMQYERIVLQASGIYRACSDWEDFRRDEWGMSLDDDDGDGRQIREVTGNLMEAKAAFMRAFDSAFFRRLPHAAKVMSGREGLISARRRTFVQTGYDFERARKEGSGWGLSGGYLPIFRDGVWDEVRGILGEFTTLERVLEYVVHHPNKVYKGKLKMGLTVGGAEGVEVAPVSCGFTRDPEGLTMLRLMRWSGELDLQIDAEGVPAGW